MPKTIRAIALLAQEYSSLHYQLVHTLPEGWKIDMSQETDPPRIMVLLARPYEGPLSRMNPGFGSIKRILMPEDLEVAQSWMAEVLQRFTKLDSKNKSAEGILNYKIWWKE